MNAAAWILLALVALLGFLLMATIRHGIAMVIKHGEQEKAIRNLTELAETQHQVIGRLLGGDPAELDTDNDEEETTQ